jgi:hypothetical protein
MYPEEGLQEGGRFMKSVNRRVMDSATPISCRLPLFQILLGPVLAIVIVSSCATERPLLDGKPLILEFGGKETEHKWDLKQLNPEWPSDWSSYRYLVMEMRASSPQRFFLRLYTGNGMRGMLLHPFGQNVWLRASVPLDYFQSWQSGQSLGTSTHRETETFWMRITGPFGDLD